MNNILENALVIIAFLCLMIGLGSSIDLLYLLYAGPPFYYDYTALLPEWADVIILIESLLSSIFIIIFVESQN